MIIRATVSYVTDICYLSIRGNRSLELFKKLYPRIGIEESTMKNYQYVTIPYFVSISTAPYYAQSMVIFSFQSQLRFITLLRMLCLKQLMSLLLRHIWPSPQYGR